jgi:hypothetical protein
MGLKLSKDQTITVSWSTLVSVVGSLAAVWGFAGPIAGQAVKGQIREQIQEEIKPLKAAQTALTNAQIITISTTVRNLQNAIAALEFKRDMCVGSADCWTVRDAQDLTAARADLVAAEAALKALRE